jgi:TRAP-type C4-dicarboxylate transport system permease small subunit
MAGHVSGAAARTGNNPFLKGVAFLSLLSGWTAAALIVISVLITCQMIFVRFVLNQSTIWQTEAVVYMMIAATMLGLPYVQYLRGHVNVDLHALACCRCSCARRWRHHVMTAVVSSASWPSTAYEYWHFAWDRNWRSDTVWGVRLWIPYLALPIGFACSCCNWIADIPGRGHRRRHALRTGGRLMDPLTLGALVASSPSWCCSPASRWPRAC